jgi:hypothetical protein
MVMMPSYSYPIATLLYLLTKARKRSEVKTISTLLLTLIKAQNMTVFFLAVLALVLLVTVTVC